MTNLAYYIGVDHREPDALAVTEGSAHAHASKPLPIGYLEHLDLRRRQLFDRSWRISEDGGYWDERDGKPFSVQFSHTRFLTPLVAKDDGHSDWALFTDCDWLFLADPWKILEEADPTKTVMVVPHDFRPTTAIKMDGQPQSRYQRKLWSAFMLWNLKSKKLPTIEMVNHADGGYLHRFGWLHDEDIGFLSERWHWVPNYSPTTEAYRARAANNQPLPIDAVHFTYGPPVAGMPDREVTAFDQMWKDELITAVRNRF
jgi:hypothetical protein